MSFAISAFASAMRPRERIGVCEWCEREVYLPYSQRSPRINYDIAPWLRPPTEAAVNNENSHVILIAPVGSGKTTFYEALVPYIISEDPGGLLIIHQTDDDSKDWAESRLHPLLRHCGAIDNLWPQNNSDVRKQEILFPHMPVFVGGAALSNLQSKSMRWVIFDEPWMYRPGRWQEGERRTHDGWNSRVIGASQGGDAGCDLHTEWKTSTQEVFHFACPECGEVQPWEWGQVRWEEVKTEKDEYDWAQLGETVRYHCKACDHAFKDTAHDRRRLAETGRYIQTNENAIPGKRGFTYTVLAVWWIAWAKIVREFLNAVKAKRLGQSEPMRIWTQKRLGQFWEEEFTDNRTELVGAGYSKAEYFDGRKIDQEAFRFMTVDRQINHFWAVVRAWRADGTSRLLYEGRIETDESARSIQEVYGVENQLVFVDAQYQTSKIYALCATYGWTAIHGSKERSFPHRRKGRKAERRFYSELQRGMDPGGRPIRYVFWSNENIKDILIAFRNGEAAAWEVPQDVSDDYRAQIDSETKKSVIDKATGQMTERWVKHKRDNHLWDCECMQIAAALMMRVLGDFTAQAAGEDSEE